MLEQKDSRQDKANRKVWGSHCKCNTHKEPLCKIKGEEDGARKVREEDHRNNDNLFMAKSMSSERSADNIQMKGIMVEGGATSHILNDIDKVQ